MLIWKSIFCWRYKSSFWFLWNYLRSKKLNYENKLSWFAIMVKFRNNFVGFKILRATRTLNVTTILRILKILDLRHLLLIHLLFKYKKYTNVYKIHCKIRRCCTRKMCRRGTDLRTAITRTFPPIRECCKTQRIYVASHKQNQKRPFIASLPEHKQFRIHREIWTSRGLRNLPRRPHP